MPEVSRQMPEEKWDALWRRAGVEKKTRRRQRFRGGRAEAETNAMFAMFSQCTQRESYDGA
jgi:hypothetical protein